MSYSQAARRDYEMRTVNPPVVETPSEDCDNCHRNDLGDTAIKIEFWRNGQRYYEYWCDECAEVVERCDQCGYVRCWCS